MRYYPDHLEHHGIKGQKWGVRRFQNPDGTRIKNGKHIVGRKYYNKSKSEGIGSIPRMEDVDILLPEETPKSLKDAFGDLHNNPLRHVNKNDCCNVYLAFEGRSRGLDVKPGHQEDGGMLRFDEVCSCFRERTDEKGRPFYHENEKISSLKDAQDLLSVYPDGSRGYFSATFRIGGEDFNHAVSWSKENGKVSFADGINGLNTAKYFKELNNTPVKYFRSDDLDLDMDVYLKYVDEP